MAKALKSVQLVAADRTRRRRKKPFDQPHWLARPYSADSECGVRPMTAAPGLTVVILTCNSSVTVATSLQSLVEQTYLDFDVLVVDDDSTDDTLDIVSGYSSRLNIVVTRNGSRNIPRGRNIGIAESGRTIVAFLDSDDAAEPDWALTIVSTFAHHPNLGCVFGDLLASYRTRTGHAIAMNDDAIRRLFRGDGSISAGNCALNRAVLPDTRFDEDFRYAEDLEFAARLGRGQLWRYESKMKVRHLSRDTFGGYAKQMYRYGSMKQYFAYSTRSYRWLDFIPVLIILCGAVTGVALSDWWPVVLIVPFSLLEAMFVTFYQRCTPGVAALTFPAWLVKNLAWSCGTIRGLAVLTLSPRTRRMLRSKRPQQNDVSGFPDTKMA